MIIDSLSNVREYAGVHPRLKQAMDYLTSGDLNSLEPGQYEIDGDHVFAFVQHYETIPIEQGIWEAHRQYFDVHFMAEGEESFGYMPIENAEVTSPYNAEGDYALFAALGDFFTLRERQFTILAPQDVHMPRILTGVARSVKKIVVKVRI